MLDPILVPMDGSQLSECVLPHAIAIARSFDAEIILLRMLEKNQAGASAQLFDLLNWQINKTRAALYLEKTKTQLEKSGLSVKTALLEGLVAEAITEYAQTLPIKLIILSSHGRNGVTQWGISGSAQKIILSAPTSLFIVRASQYKANPAETPEQQFYQHILVPLDGSQRAENVLPIITQLAKYHKSQIHLVQVVQTPEMARQMPLEREDIEISNQVVARNQDEAGRYLEQVKSRSVLEGITVITHLVTSDNAAVSLHKMVEQENIQLVTLSAHGYSGIRQWPYGNMVNNFIMYGKTSLLIVQDLPAEQDSSQIGQLSRELAEH